MNSKRGLIYLVFFLLIPFVYSQQLTCSDGTRFATCKTGTNQFCSNPNMILNSGFETDSNQDRIPDNFLPQGNLGSDLIYSGEHLAGTNSILITKQYASFDYQLGGRQAITLQPSTEYLFFAFIKGSCQNPRVYASTSQTGSAENVLCSGNCALTNYANGWKRLTTIFNSNSISTKFPENQGENPFLAFLRVECADSTPFQLFVDNMHLQPVNAPPVLAENCQICGSCSSGLFCAPDGSCVSDLSRFYTDEELMERCIAENNFALCEKIQNPIAKPIAFNQFAVENNDISKCQDIICKQSVLYFSCLDQGRANCNEESLSIFEQNPSFADSGDIYIRYQERQSINEKVEKFKLGSGRSNRPINRCEIHVKRELGDSSYNDYYQYSLGTIISQDSNLKSLAVEVEGERQTYGETTNNFPWFMERDCGNNNCNLLEGDVIAPKADLLCGGDARWHLCDRDGIKTSGIVGFPQFICDGASGAWIEVI